LWAASWRDSFVIRTTERVLVNPRWRVIAVVGFCGSFTTFSNYAFEAISFFEQGQWGLDAGQYLRQQSAWAAL
jgi:fluoride ion exporter CrcB/FEX